MVNLDKPVFFPSPPIIILPTCTIQTYSSHQLVNITHRERFPHRYGRRFVNNNQVLVRMQDIQGVGGDWRFMAMHTVTQEIIVIYDRVH